MCLHYLDKFPGVKIPQWRVNDDAIEHHFRIMRGVTGDNTTPTIQECCAATRHANIIQLFGNQAGNSGGSPVGADANDVDFDARSHAPAVESSAFVDTLAPHTHRWFGEKPNAKIIEISASKR